MHEAGQQTARTPMVSQTDATPRVSVIVPCRNEAAWIERCLESIAANDFPKDQMELLVLDGMSTDGTRAIIGQSAPKFPWMRLLDNPRKTAPAAMNIGIAAARGKIVVRMDAHNEYPSDYISKLVYWLEKSGADNVGGVSAVCPSNDTAAAKAIAFGCSHFLGVGNARYRIGVTKPTEVDTVPFGCYRREVFEKIGPFDEELVRNQDDELNLRLIRAGGRILLVPEVVFRYYARDSLAKLWRMNFQYGYFKPLVVRKIGRVMTARQLVPSLFIASLLITGIVGVWSRLALGAFLFLVGAYLLAIACVAFKAAPRHGLACAAWLFPVFPTMHFAYGLGFLKGIWHFLILRRPGVRDTTQFPISR